MKFNSQICTTKEQSERLLALGLKKETADMYYTNASLLLEKDKFHLECKDYSQLQKEVISQICPFTFIPAWSLHRLIEISNIQRFHIVDKVMVEDGECKTWFGDYGNKLYDNTIDLIEWLIKEGHFNKEYLEE